jgi:hypothetical protein
VELPRLGKLSRIVVAALDRLVTLICPLRIEMLTSTTQFQSQSGQ